MDAGLEGIVVARTALSDVDGERGRLVVRGLDLEELAEKDFEDVAALLWGELVDRPVSGEELRVALGAARVAAFERIAPVLPVAARAGAVEGLKLCLSALGGAPGELGSLPEALVDPVRVTAAIPVAIAARTAIAQGREPVRPRPEEPHVADFLRMLRSAPAEPAEVAALQTYLVTVAEHGMNASTFTARVVASTRAGAPWAVLAAYCALVGPLHGGAPGPVLDMLDAIGTPDRADEWISAELAAGNRLMGFGHRLYRTRDPRADVLKQAVRQLRDAQVGRDSRLALAEHVERAALSALERHRPGRRLETNVEFYTAVLLDALGVERAAFTPVFAAGRVLGWCAHALEQARTGRLIRPASQYVGARARQLASRS